MYRDILLVPSLVEEGLVEVLLKSQQVVVVVKKSCSPNKLSAA